MAIKSWLSTTPEESWEKCKKLASLPGKIGTPRPDLHKNIRSISFENYIILFQYTDNLLEIVTIIEGHRDIGTIFNRGYAVDCPTY